MPEAVRGIANTVKKLAANLDWSWYIGAIEGDD